MLGEAESVRHSRVLTEEVALEGQNPGGGTEDSRAAEGATEKGRGAENQQASLQGKQIVVGLGRTAA